MKRPHLWIGLAAAVIVALVAGVAIGVARGHQNVAATGSGASTTSSTALPLTTSAAIQQWVKSNSTTYMNLVNDVNLFSADAAPCSSEGYAACSGSVGSACSSIEGAAQAAQGAPEIPNPAAEQDWATALSDYVQGAQECTGALDGRLDMTLLDQAIQELTAAKGELANLVDLAGGQM